MVRSSVWLPFLIAVLSILIFSIMALVGAAGAARTADPTKLVEPIKIGWIGSMTGPTAKYGTYQAALLAEEEINQTGGINGRPLKLIYEDAHGDGASAVSAFQKLTGIDHVSFVIGGHCTPESLAVAPLAESHHVISIASVTSTPKLTNAGDYVFRLTTVSTVHADLIARYAFEQRGIRKLAILHELTDYVAPPAERLKEVFEKLGGKVTSFNSFNRGETDFRSLLMRAASQKPDALYFAVQAPDTAVLLIKQLRQLGLKHELFTNEQVSGALASASPDVASLFDGVVFGEPECDLTKPVTASFAERYNSRFHTGKLPFGCYTPESYDAIRIVAEGLKRCGENVECVKTFLYQLRDFPGASGEISFDQNGDVSKPYSLKLIWDGKIATLSPKA